MRRRQVGAALAIVLVLLTAACSGDDGDALPTPSTIDPDDVTTTAPPPDPEQLPPAGALDLEPIYGAQLEALGLRLTDRGGLIDRSGGGYAPSAEGTHLALYVEPIGDRTLPQYLDGIRSVAVVFGDVFERWPGLVSYDVCQEPTAAADARDEPLPVTQIELTKEEAEAIDFDTVTVVELVRASLADPPGLALRVSSTVARDPAYLAIVDQAT